MFFFFLQETKSHERRNRTHDAVVEKEILTSEPIWLLHVWHFLSNIYVNHNSRCHVNDMCMDECDNFAKPGSQLKMNALSFVQELMLFYPLLSVKCERGGHDRSMSTHWTEIRSDGWRRNRLLWAYTRLAQQCVLCVMTNRDWVNKFDDTVLLSLEVLMGANEDWCAVWPYDQWRWSL